MAEILSEIPERTLDQLLVDLRYVCAGIGDMAPAVELVLSMTDYQILRGVAGRKDLHREEPWMVKLLGLHVSIPLDYNGPPRIVDIVSKQPVDVIAEREKRDALSKRTRWLASDLRLRQGITGRPL